MPVTKAGEEMPNTPNMTTARSSRVPRRSAASDAEQDAGDEHDQRADQAEDRW